MLYIITRTVVVVVMMELHFVNAQDQPKQKWRVVDYLQKDAKRKNVLRSSTRFFSFWHNLGTVVDVPRDLYVALDTRNRLVGYMVVNRLTYNRKGDKVKLSILEVLPTYRRKGAGTAMVNFIVDTAREEEQSSVSLLAANNSNIFWEKMGFQVVKDDDPNSYVWNI